MKDTEDFVSNYGKNGKLDAGSTVNYGATVIYGGDEKPYGGPLLVYGRGM